jgi:hypothetical protein
MRRQEPGEVKKFVMKPWFSDFRKQRKTPASAIFLTREMNYTNKEKKYDIFRSGTNEER